MRESNMNKRFAMLAAMTLSTAALAQEMTKPAAKEGVTPMMVSFADLKWTELPGGRACRLLCSRRP
jgi:hypothetical protein